MTAFEDWLDETFGGYHQPKINGGSQVNPFEYVVSCPYCGAVKRLYLNPVKRAYNCMKCGGGKLVPWMEELTGWPIKTILALLRNEESDHPLSDFTGVIASLQSPSEEQGHVGRSALQKEIAQHFRLVGFGDSDVDRFIEPYLRSRGFTIQDAADYGFAFAVGGRFSNRLIIPVYEGRGTDRVMVYFQARAVFGAEPKYLNPGLNDGLSRDDWVFNLNMVEASQSPAVYVMEGAFNAMSVGQHCSIATFGKTISETQAAKIKSRIAPGAVIVICFDYGADKETAAAVQVLSGQHKVGWVQMPDARDLNDWRCEGLDVWSLVGAAQWGSPVGLMFA